MDTSTDASLLSGFPVTEFADVSKNFNDSVNPLETMAF